MSRRGLVASAIIAAAIALLSAALRGGVAAASAAEGFRAWSDGFFIAGVFVGGAGLLAFASSDGLFDVIFIDKLNRPAILRLLSRFIKGQHVDMPIAHESRCTALTIRCPGMTVNMDGELYQMDEAKYRILPGAAQIMI